VEGGGANVGVGKKEALSEGTASGRSKNPYGRLPNSGDNRSHIGGNKKNEEWGLDQGPCAHLSCGFSKKQMGGEKVLDVRAAFSRPPIF